MFRLVCAHLQRLLVIVVIESSDDSLVSCVANLKKKSIIQLPVVSPFHSVSFFIARRFINAPRFIARVFLTRAAFLAPILIASDLNSIYRFHLPSFHFPYLMTFFSLLSSSLASILCRPIERARFYTFDRPFLLIGFNGTLSLICS